MRSATVGVAALAVLLAVWATVDAVRAQRRLESARAALTAVGRDREGLTEPSRRSASIRQLRSASTDAATAAAVVRKSVPLRVAGVVPVLRAQRDGVRRLGEDVADAATSAARTLEVAGTIVDAGAATGALVPVDRTEELRAAVADTARTLRRTSRGAASLVGPVAEARRRYDEVADENAETLQHAADALGAVRPFAGGDGPRRYLVLGLNNAEMRQSGMALSYAVVRADAGRLAIERRGPVTDLRLAAAVPVERPSAGTAEAFDVLEPTRLWQSVNATADWPWTAKAALAMYARATGDQLDGVLAIDVVGLAEVLRVTGPVTAEGITTAVTAENAADVLLHDLYEGLAVGSDQGPRREAVAGVASAVMTSLTDRPPDRVRLALALGRAAAGGHLRVASNAPGEQEVFARLGPGDGPDGPTAETAARTFHYAVQNGNGTKLDYHLRTRVTFDVTTTEAGNAVVRTTIGLGNGAPAGAAPSYALGPNLGLDHPPGRYDGRVHLWAPAGSSAAGAVDDAGLAMRQTVAQVEAGATATVTFETVLRGAVRDGRLALRLVPQPRLRPADLEIRLNGTTVHSGRWHTTIDEIWPIS